jgi:L-lactate dehydrogenase complex protein LldG
MGERENILGRIREALTIAAPIPGHHGEAHPPKSDRPASSARQWLTPVGETFEQQAALFTRNAGLLKASFHLLNSREELKSKLRELSAAERWAKLATHAGDLNDLARHTLKLPALSTDAAYDVNALEACNVGITGCDALVAQTGSVLITSRSAGGRALSVLPPHHVVLARRDQLLPDLPAAFDLLKKKYAGAFPSFISFITGPSRTGDIERILVLGAHGPKKLTIFCV